MRNRTLDLVVYAIPAAIFLFALVMGVRVLWPEPPAPVTVPTPEITFAAPCAAGRYRCRAAQVEVMTGEERVTDAATTSERCVVRSVSHCRVGCVSDEATLAGVDELTAHRQLCDLPAQVGSLVSEEQMLLDQPALDAEPCEGDGYAPQSERIVQCLLRSGLDPNATGMVLGFITCRHGVVPTLDRRPRLLKREQAIALWCRRPAPEAHLLLGPTDADLGASVMSSSSLPGDAQSMSRTTQTDASLGTAPAGRALDAARGDVSR